MAKKDTITYRTGAGTDRQPCVNVHFRVGIGGDNSAADVMLIQTLFHYFGHYEGRPHPKLGFPLREMPAITGDCDLKTNMAILNFQRANRHSLHSVDGLIHPASYEGRNIKTGERRVMTITLLHFFANEMSINHPEPHYIDGLVKMVPDLRPWLM